MCHSRLLWGGEDELKVFARKLNHLGGIRRPSICAFFNRPCVPFHVRRGGRMLTANYRSKLFRSPNTFSPPRKTWTPGKIKGETEEGGTQEGGQGG